jgi:hypothetical protein
MKLLKVLRLRGRAATPRPLAELALFGTNFWMLDVAVKPSSLVG